MSLSTALRTRDLAELPSRRDEDWRWTDLRGLLRVLPPQSAPAIAPDAGPFAALTPGTILFVNGEAIFPDIDERGNTANGRGGVMGLRFVSVARDTSHTASAPLVFSPGTKTVVLESYEGHGSGYVTDVALEFDLEEGAQVERIVFAADVPDAITVSHATVRLAADARFSQTILTTGAKRQRFETHVENPGNAEVRLDGVYVLSDQRHADQTSVVTHSGLQGTTTQLTKGMVTDQARGVFQGRIVVAKGADRTDARMGHHALILSDRAEVDAKPELEIWADDVACAHGNTVGALDEEALFYALSRGIPAEATRAMLIQAFLSEVVERIEHEGARDLAAAWLAARLGGQP